MASPKLLLLVVLIVAIVSQFEVSALASAFYQCDSRWGKDVISGSNTICKVGCLMSSVALSLYSRGITLKVGGKVVDANPGTFNKFLKANGGYQGALFVHTAVNKVAKNTGSSGVSTSYYGSAGQLSASAVSAHLKAGRTLVANVNCKNCHWVAVNNVNAQGNLVVRNSSGSSAKTVYTPTQVYQYRIYSIKGPKSGAFMMQDEVALAENNEAVEVDEVDVEAYEQFADEMQMDEDYEEEY